MKYFKGECALMDGYKVVKPWRPFDYDTKQLHFFLTSQGSSWWKEGAECIYVQAKNPYYVRLIGIFKR